MSASLEMPRVQRPYLSESSLSRLRDLLLSELQVEHAQRDSHEAAAALLRDETDPDSILEFELAEAGATRTREAIEDIEEALRRMDLGTYGWCEACGAQLPFERLEAVPAARRCVACPGRGAGLLR